jgi:hypothetical protein
MEQVLNGARLGRNSIHAGLRMEPDGTKILYLRSDESAVKEYDSPVQEQLYPVNTASSIQKGETNSTVSLHVYDLIHIALAPFHSALRHGHLSARFGFTGTSTVWLCA